MKRSRDPGTTGESSELEGMLRRLGAAGAVGQPEGEHPDPEQLAAWLDGELLDGEPGESESAELERHLATCAECRALARDTAAALAFSEGDGRAVPVADPPRFHPREASSREVRESAPRAAAGRPRWALPVAAAALLTVAILVLAALLGGIGRWRSADPRLPSLGVGIGRTLLAERQLLDAASAALDGQWPTVPALDALPPPAEMVAVRGPEAGAAPMPLEPRWETTAEIRPTFHWRHALGVTEGKQDERYELLVLDGSDQLVARWEIGREELPAGSVLRSEPPPELELQPGSAYAWKVNRLTHADWPVASAYAPFLVLPAAEAEELERRLRAEPAVLLRAALWAGAGAYSRARAELRSLPGPKELQRRLLDPLRRRQYLGPTTDGENEELEPP
ncbi:MAG: zf-HC2 domain-containing protein [Holophagales bacterium]|nr:zf-HC2 domain-containing protein [Holophagales bacterium]